MHVPDQSGRPREGVVVPLFGGAVRRETSRAVEVIEAAPSPRSARETSGSTGRTGEATAGATS